MKVKVMLAISLLVLTVGVLANMSIEFADNALKQESEIVHEESAVVSMEIGLTAQSTLYQCIWCRILKDTPREIIRPEGRCKKSPHGMHDFKPRDRR